MSCHDFDPVSVPTHGILSNPANELDIPCPCPCGTLSGMLTCGLPGAVKELRLLKLVRLLERERALKV